MPNRPADQTEYQLQLEELRARLAESEEALRAIRCGEVDALVVPCQTGEQVFTIKGADQTFRVLIEDMNEGALTLTEEGVILYANRRLGEMLKAPLEKIIGSSIHAWIAHESIKAIQELLRRDEKQTRRRGEVKLLASDGSILPGYLSLNMLQKEDMQGYFGMVATDLTEQKNIDAIKAAEDLAQKLLASSEQSRLVLLSMIEDQQRTEEALRESEEKLSRMNQELEQRVAERTADMEKANKELEAFSYTVSHDLRAPLRHINGFLNMFRIEVGEIANEKAHHYMEVISESAERMGQLIDDLLSFSRMGRAELNIRTVDIGRLVDEVLEGFSEEIETKTIDIIRGPLPLVQGDQAMLRVVLTNLISNAVKFTSGADNKKIEIGCDSKNGESICFVKDNGAGFDMRYVGKLFGVFQRLHSEKDFEGTGIGLATVKRIIQHHGGRVWAEGELGRGARFYFSLPKPDEPRKHEDTEDGSYKDDKE